MSKVGIFVDGANIYYGLRGRRIDYKHFLDWLSKGRQVAEASYFNAWRKDDQSMQTFFAHVKKAGFNTYIKATTKNSATGKWKQAGIDVYLAVKAMRFSNNFDTIVLVSGDYDYMPLIDEMIRWKKKIEVVSFEYAMHPIYNRWTVRSMDEYVATYATGDVKKEKDKNFSSHYKDELKE